MKSLLRKPSLLLCAARAGRSIAASLVLLFAGCGGGSDTPAAVARLEVSPTAVLLNGAGKSQSLKVRAYDVNGVEVSNAPITFTSSKPDQVSVGTDGTVRAQVAVGSSLVFEVRKPDARAAGKAASEFAIRAIQMHYDR